MLDRGKEHPVLTGQANGSDLDVGVFQFPADGLGGFGGAQALEVRGVTDLDLVVIDPQVNQFLGLAADDDLVVAGVLEFGCEEAAHHRIRHQLGLRRDGRDDGPVAAWCRRPTQ